jgi:luciferase family oxidoreductase group 1
MLPHYSPLKVAENFSILSGLYPGRIDLGVGRAPGGDPGSAFALQRDRRRGGQDDFPDQLAELTGYLDGTLPPGHPFARFMELPGRPERPDIWLLGTSAQSAIWAGEQGLPYACADFINPEGAINAELYRTHFRPSSRLATPKVAVAVAALCADSEEEAQRLAASVRMVYLLFREGRFVPIPPPGAAQDFLRQRGLPLDVNPPGRRLVFGAPDRVRSGLLQVARDYTAEEILIVTLTHSHLARVRSYELLATAFNLPTQK